jgi:hypothetical protein
MALTSPPAAADKLSIVEAFFEDPERRIVRNLTLNAGETCYFTYKVSGFKLDPKQHFSLEYRIQLLYPKGEPVVEDLTDKVEATLAPQDQNWLPKIDYEKIVPTFAPAGDYQIKVHVEDKLGKAEVDYTGKFSLRGETVDLGDKMSVQQFIFSDTDNGRQKGDEVFHQGSTLFARFKLSGYKIVDKGYWVEQDLSIRDGAGKVLFSNPTSTEKNKLFYPQRVLTNSFNLDVSKGVKPGEYILHLDIRDKLGEQAISYEARFKVEP